MWIIVGLRRPSFLLDLLELPNSSKQKFVSECSLYYASTLYLQKDLKNKFTLYKPIQNLKKPDLELLSFRALRLQLLGFHVKSTICLRSIAIHHLLYMVLWILYLIPKWKATPILILKYFVNFASNYKPIPNSMLFFAIPS
jgi:hypothetical protein